MLGGTAKASSQARGRPPSKSESVFPAKTVDDLGIRLPRQQSPADEAVLHVKGYCSRQFFSLAAGAADSISSSNFPVACVLRLGSTSIFVSEESPKTFS